MSNLNLKGLWIPIEILTDTNLSDKEKHIYSIVMFLSKENNYCYCTNSNISELLNISITQVSKLVNSLKKKGYIDIDIKYKDNSKEIESRNNRKWRSKKDRWYFNSTIIRNNNRKYKRNKMHKK